MPISSLISTHAQQGCMTRAHDPGTWPGHMTRVGAGTTTTVHPYMNSSHSVTVNTSPAHYSLQKLCPHHKTTRWCKT